MITLLVILLVVAVLAGGLGYNRRVAWGRPAYYGPSAVAVLLVILLLLFLTGILR